MVKLKDKMHALQEELLNKQGSELLSATSQVELHRQTQDLQKECEKLRAELCDANQNVGKVEQQKAQLSSALTEQKSTLDLLKNEYQRTRALMEESEKDVQELSLGNRDLVNRLVSEKGKFADEMNEMNTIIEKLKSSMPAEAVPVTAGDDLSMFRSGGGGSSVPGIEPPTAAVHTIKAHATEINSLALNASGTLLASGSSDNSLKVWEKATGKLRCALHGSTQAVMAVDLDNNVVIGASKDRAIRVWLLSSQRVRHTLTGHAGSIYSARLSPDSKSLVSGSTDRSLKIWDMNRGVCEGTMASRSTVNCICMSASGNVICSGHHVSAPQR